MDWELFSLNWEFATLFMVVGALSFIGAVPFCWGMADLARAITNKVKGRKSNPKLMDAFAVVGIGGFFLLVAFGLAYGGSMTISDKAECQAKGYTYQDHVCYSQLERAE